MKTSKDLLFKSLTTHWINAALAGSKSSTAVARAILHALRVFWINNERILAMLRLTLDSGAGMPESLEKELEIFNQPSFTDSCGIHDTISVIHLPIQLCIGNGGLGKENTRQFLHTVFSIQKQLR